MGMDKFFSGLCACSILLYSFEYNFFLILLVVKEQSLFRREEMLRGEQYLSVDLVNLNVNMRFVLHVLFTVCLSPLCLFKSF